MPTSQLNQQSPIHGAKRKDPLNWKMGHNALCYPDYDGHPSPKKICLWPNGEVCFPDTQNEVSFSGPVDVQGGLQNSGFSPLVDFHLASSSDDMTVTGRYKAQGVVTSPSSMEVDHVEDVLEGANNNNCALSEHQPCDSWTQFSDSTHLIRKCYCRPLWEGTGEARSSLVDYY